MAAHSILILVVLFAGFVARLVWLENRLKAYRGQGRISLVSGRLPLWVQYCVTLPPLEGKGPFCYDLTGLPARRIYAVVLVVPSALEIPAWKIRPYRLTIQAQDEVVTVADAACLPLSSHFEAGLNRFHFPLQASFKLPRLTALTCEVIGPDTEDLGLTEPAYLMVTSQPL